MSLGKLGILHLARPWVLIACALSMTLSGCSLLSSEMNLSPIFAFHRNAYGDTSWEALGGLITRDSTPKMKDFAIHPIFRTATDDQNVRETDVIYPFGFERRDGVETKQRFFPLYYWNDRINEKGLHDIDWMFFPFFGGGGDGGESYFALFPLYGVLKDFLTFERIQFILWPLYFSTKKASGRESINFVWPFFGYSWGGGHHGFRVFPIYSQETRDNRYANYTLFWPLFHWGSSELDEEEPGSHFLFFPFYGHSKQKGFEAWSVLPPFVYGYSKNEKTGYYAYDILWPFIKVERGGNQAERTRVLPFFAFYDGKEMKGRTFLWPLIWIREETASHYTRTSNYVIPFWYNWHKKEDKGAESSYWHAWPFAHREWHSEGESDFAFPSPFLFRHFAPRVDENFGVLWTLYRQKTGRDGEFSSRFFANLYRREKGHGEERISVPILFGYRKKDDGTTEWSFLAGLLRLRSDSSGTGMMMPSFPGPGWDE